ncbi:MAG: sigma-70 family RNA polymerase sigma factor [Lentisphaeria bacterium]|nr:sigma-70 family RNA polymerase sigma factor [Lentisphaeria bacterium]
MSYNSIDRKAFEILVQEHHRRLLGYAFALVSSREVAEDLVQDAFVTAFYKLSTFDASRNFGAWMRGIVRIKFLEWCRKKKEFAISPAELDLLEEQHHEWDNLANEPGDIMNALAHCMKTLPNEMGETVDLYYLKELSGTETAKQLDVQESTIRKRLQRARQKLALCINNRLSQALEVEQGVTTNV